jgi:hypothetical protein
VREGVLVREMKKIHSPDLEAQILFSFFVVSLRLTLSLSLGLRNKVLINYLNKTNTLVR